MLLGHYCVPCVALGTTAASSPDDRSTDTMASQSGNLKFRDANAVLGHIRQLMELSQGGDTDQYKVLTKIRDTYAACMAFYKERDICPSVMESYFGAPCRT